MSSSSPNSLSGVLSNPALLQALYPNLNLTSLAQLYTEEQQAMEQPVQEISTQLQTITSQSTAWQAIQSGVSTLQQDFQALAQTSTWQSSAAASTNESAVTASASSTATQGTYLIDVTKVGQPEIAVSGNSTYSSATSALNLNAETDTINGASIDITSSDSLNSLAQKINGANAGVTASVIDDNGAYYLSLTTTSDQAFTYSGQDLFGTSAQGPAIDATNPAQPASPWQYTVNNSLEVSSTSATDSQTIPGITLTLQGTGTSVVSVSTSSNPAQQALGQLASDYNSLQATISKYTGKGDVLAGDATAEGIMGQINRELFTYNTSLPVGYQTVADAGLTLTLNADKTTTLNFSSSTFSSAYAANPTALQSLFAGTSGGSGLAGSLSTQLQSLSAPATGVIATVLQGYQSEIQSLNANEQAQQNLVQLQQTALGNQFNQEISTLVSLLGQQSTVSSLINAVEGNSNSSNSNSKG